jgi:hypothetical protein
MAYGELKVDSITFTDGGTDTTVSVSGLVQNPTFSGDITVTGTISGSVVQGGTTVSGATVTGTAGEFGTVTGNTAGFTTVTGTTVTGTTANFASGVFTTQVSGATVTGNLAQFTTLTGGTAGFTTVTGTTVTGSAGQFGTVTGNTAGFTTVTGTTVTGTTANFVTVSGTTVTGNAGNFTTATVTSGVFASGTAAAPSVSVGTTDNGLYSPGTDQLAISTNGTGRLFVDAGGNVGVRQATPLDDLHISSSTPALLFEETDAGTNEKYWRIRANNSILIFEGINDAFNYIDPWLKVTRTTGATTVDNIAFSTGISERLRITSDGKVGLGTPTPDALLTVNGVGAHGLGSAAAPSFAFTGDLNTGLYSPGADQVAISTGGTGRLFVDASGNVGVGIDTPTANLHVKSNVNPTIRIEDQGEYLDITYNDNSSTLSIGVINADNGNTSVADTELRIGVDGASRYVTKTDGSHTFYQTNGSTESLKITSDGKVGLGTSSPATLLHLSSKTGTSSPTPTELRIATTNSGGDWSTTDSWGRISYYNGDSSAGGPKIHAAIDAIANGSAGTSSGLDFKIASNTDATLNSVMHLTYEGNVGIGTTNPSSLLHLADAGDITVGTTTGTKIGTATSQKIGFYDATPVVQPTTGVAEAAFVENSGGTAVNVDSTFGGYTIQQVVEALQTLGLLA